MTKRVNKVSDFMENGKWKCISCGACCAYIKPLTDNGRLPAYWSRPDGSCINLNEKKECRIYAKRPNVCRVDVELKPKCKDIEIARMCKVLKDFVEKV